MLYFARNSRVWGNFKVDRVRILGSTYKVELGDMFNSLFFWQIIIDIRSSLQKIYSDIQKVSGNSIFPLQDTEVQSAGKLINKDY